MVNLIAGYSILVGVLMFGIRVVVSAGYYAQRHQGPVVAMFAALAVLPLASVIHACGYGGVTGG